MSLGEAQRLGRRRSARHEGPAAGSTVATGFPTLWTEEEADEATEIVDEDPSDDEDAVGENAVAYGVGGALDLLTAVPQVLLLPFAHPLLAVVE